MIRTGLLLLLLVAPVSARGQDHPKPKRLELVREAKCSSLFDAKISYNASGVTLRGGKLYVVFDGHHSVGVVDPSLKGAGTLVNVDEKATTLSDYEGIAHDPKGGHLFVVREGVRVNGVYRPELIELDGELKQLSRVFLDPIESAAKGVEGLVFLRHGDADYLLALLEGNHGAGGLKGKDKGNGRVRVYKRSADGWAVEAVIALPKRAAFKDYAGIDLRKGRLAVISQATSRLWIGILDPDAWTVDDGQVYKLPKAGEGAKYDTTEGVAWLTDDTVAITSDEAKPDKPEGKAKAQSIHVFKIPPSGR